MNRWRSPRRLGLILFATLLVVAGLVLKHSREKKAIAVTKDVATNQAERAKTVDVPTNRAANPPLPPEHMRTAPDGPAIGRGVLEWRRSGKVDRYEGEMREGWSNGHGVYSNANGERYEGNWIDGCPRTGSHAVTLAGPTRDCP